MKLWRFAVFLFALHAFANAARAFSLDPRLQMTQYGHRVWRVEDGGLPGQPTDMVQTSDGYLWISTTNGLVRFDGVTFKTWRDLSGDDTHIPAVLTLAVGRDGTLWVGCVSGLFKIAPHGSKLERILPGRINGVKAASDGTVWATRSRLGDDPALALCRLTPHVQCFGESDGVRYPYGTTLALSSAGEPWMGSSQGLSVGVGARSRQYAIPGLMKGKGLAGVAAVLVNGEQDALVGTETSGLGLLHLQQGHWTSIPIGGPEAKEVAIESLFRCKSGELFIGTFGNGLYRIIADKTEHYDHSSGLSGDTINQIFEDSESNLWVLTQEGVDEFYPARVARVNKQNGIKHGTAATVVQRANGEIWVGDHDHIDVIAPGTTHADRWIPIDGQVTGLFVDRSDRVWAGINRDLVTFDGDRPKLVKADSGIIQNIREDSSGTLWFVTASPDYQVFRKAPGQELQTVDVPLKKRVLLVEGATVWFLDELRGTLYSPERGMSSLPSDSKRLFAGHVTGSLGSHGIWIANRKGVALFHDGKFRLMTTQNGLSCSNSYASVEDYRHDLWIVGDCGIQRIRASDIDRWLLDEKARFKIDEYGARDGGAPEPTIFDQGQLVAQDGRIWFTTESDLMVIDPFTIDAIKVIAPLVIQGASADHKSIPAMGQVKISSRIHDFEISYASLNFREADRMKFRYRLIPYDTEWIEAGSRRTAYYTTVPPGRYLFEVSAQAPHGDWSPSPIRLGVDVVPAYYQTLWFRVFLTLLLAGTLGLAFRLRIRYVTTDMQRRMDTQMAERVRIARELHDTILQGFYGMLMRVQSAANNLSKNESARLSIEKSLDEAEATLRQGRETIRELRGEANAEEDLLSALQTMAGGMTLDGTNEVSYRVTGIKRRLHPLVRSELLRIGREALWNALSHAAASRIEVVVACDTKGVTLSVSDDGKGIDSEILKRGTRDGHWGLRGMQERSEGIGAVLQITSTLNVGTRVSLHVPASLAFVQSLKNAATNLEP